ncbi:MAG: Dolichyl-phosphate-mannose-protein mannosyltransferase family protein [Candidatus Gottesmanbacteria bacterium GW2011_GWA1_47_8]|uniref:Dolichyl-phosphate-mannose-protein mannosyltransferase family protein n=1 Tax=Candidatus Gottesmanbacteria bacterium GW2011_GWA1_47_8 TaxID=1618438 RepID=A0A0G1VSC1_9BACT|nr:MAG: Dolichyl-phosphate-mannose-protein mannosyltransferase family protein [Candidatus Gottesmanbacteria bacterium GW2011_GWA1_47_8]
MRFKAAVPWLLLWLVALNIFLAVKNNWATFTATYDPVEELQYYQHSRYFQGDKVDYLPSDTRVHAIRGYQFIVLFQDPQNTLHDHPLLGTYLIGLSILLFHNPVVLSLFVGIAVLWLSYRLAILITGSKVLALLAVALMSFEPLFIEQIASSLLDLYLLFFSLAALVAYLLWQKEGNRNYLWLSQLCLGFAFATKFFISSLPLFVALYLSSLATNDLRRFLRHTQALIFIPAGFLAGHMTYFYYHPSLISFAKYQRYLLSWWAGTPTIKPLGVWPLIFQNQWHTWWGAEAVVTVPDWWWGWPFFIALGILSLPLLWILREKVQAQLAAYLFVIFNLVFFSLSLVFPRYLVLILPVAICLTLKLVEIVFLKKHKLSTAVK